MEAVRVAATVGPGTDGGRGGTRARLGQGVRGVAGDADVGLRRRGGGGGRGHRLEDGGVRRLPPVRLCGTPGRWGRCRGRSVQRRREKGRDGKGGPRSSSLVVGRREVGEVAAVGLSGRRREKRCRRDRSVEPRDGVDGGGEASRVPGEARSVAGLKTKRNFVSLSALPFSLAFDVSTWLAVSLDETRLLVVTTESGLLSSESGGERRNEKSVAPSESALFRRAEPPLPGIGVAIAGTGNVSGRGCPDMVFFTHSLSLSSLNTAILYHVV